MTSWVATHWLQVIVPLLVFIAVVLLGFAARWTIHRVLQKQRLKTNWVSNSFVIETIWNAFIFWFILLGAYIAFEVSILPGTGKKLAGEGLATIFVISMMITLTRWSGRLVRFHLGKTEATQSLTSVIQNVARTTIIIIGLLILFDIWGFPTFPITLVLIAAIFIVVFAFRNTLDNLLAGLEIAYGEHIKVVHLIKLVSGETGHVKKISWTRTVLQTNEGNLVIIPNYKLMANIIINHGNIAAEMIDNSPQKVVAASKKTNPGDKLSDRECEVLQLIGEGATNREIAEKLIISEHTAKSHLRSIRNKLNLRNRQQAAVYAERCGLGSEPESPKKTLTADK